MQVAVYILFKGRYHKSNLRQRVLGNTNPVKLGRCFDFLNDYYGFTQGGNHGNQYTLPNEKVFTLANSDSPKNQSELAESYGITKQTMNNYMRMAIGTLAYDTKEEVMEWMLDIQLGRRNLSPIQRITVAEKYRPIYEKQAKERQATSTGGANPQLTQNFVEADKNKKRSENETNAKLAKVANVNRETYRQAKRVLDSNNDDLKQRVLLGKTSISAGYKELTQEKNEDFCQKKIGNKIYINKL